MRGRESREEREGGRGGRREGGKKRGRGEREGERGSVNPTTMISIPHSPILHVQVLPPAVEQPGGPNNAGPPPSDVPYTPHHGTHVHVHTSFL